VHGHPGTGIIKESGVKIVYLHANTPLLFATGNESILSTVTVVPFIQSQLQLGFCPKEIVRAFIGMSKNLRAAGG
jgi:hypothetical protein